MTWPAPLPGLVIRYSYLWHHEARAGLEEGRKDRPCAVVLALQTDEGRTRVYAVPITHSAPGASTEAVEIPAKVKLRLGLDRDQSCIVVSEANVFAWPGPDLRFLPGHGPTTAAYGFLPPRLFRLVRERFLAIDRAKAKLVTRTE